MRRFFYFVCLMTCAYSLNAQTSSNLQGQNNHQQDLIQLSKEADLSMRQRDYKRAVLAWSNIADNFSTLTVSEKSVVLFQRAVCYLRLGADSSALPDVSSSIALVPNANAYFVRSLIHLRKKMYFSAMTDIEQAIALEPDNGEFYLLRGNIHLQMGKQYEGCADFAMARILGAGITGDLSSDACKVLGFFQANNADSLSIPTLPKATGAIANIAMQSLMLGTNNLNTSFYRLSVQVIYGSSSPLLSRLFYDVRSGNATMINIGYSLSREFSLWGGVYWSALPYTHFSELSQIANKSEAPFGNVTQLSPLVGAQYATPWGNNVDVQLSLGVGYNTTNYPVDRAIVFNNGSIRRANLGIGQSAGLALHSSIGVEWRFMRQLALSGNVLFGLSFAEYNFLTTTRRDQEKGTNFLGLSAGLRFYCFEW